MSLPTQADLVERLREVYGVDGRKLSYEALAVRVGVSLSTVNRWKDGSERFDQIVSLLHDAGWLAPGGETNQSQGLDDVAVARAIDELADLLARQRRVLERLLPPGDEREQPQREAAVAGRTTKKHPNAKQLERLSEKASARGKRNRG